MSDGYLPPLMESPEPASKVAQVKILHSLGYFDGLSAGEVLAAMRDDRLSDAIAKWQAFHSRPITGELSFGDSALLLAPRCAVADILEVSGDGIRQWGVKEITFSSDLSAVGLNRLSAQQIDNAINAALASVRACCGLTIRLVPWSGAKATNIWARALRIDGASGTLAWSYLPNDDSPASARLEQRYEPGEAWTEKYLQGVLEHEIGHALGMEHSNSQSDLMYPYMRTNIWTYQAGDIKRLVQRYGKPISPPPVDPPPTDPPSGDISKVTVTKSDGSTVDFYPRGSFYSF